jgi:acyl dehydratase
VISISVSETTLGTTIGNLGMENINFPHPVFINDTLRVTTVIKDKLASKSKPDRGVVWFEHSAYNQRGELVCQCLRKGMMIRDSHLNTTS